MVRSVIAADLTCAEAEGTLAEARRLYEHNDFHGAVNLIERVQQSTQYVPGMFYLKSQCFEGLNWPTQALQAATAEVLVNSDYPGAADRAKRFRELCTAPGTNHAGARPWVSALNPAMITHFEHCSHRQMYRSVPLIKNVFDLAIYPMLLWDVKPQTIIEVGSCYGASAMWMADMCVAWGLQTHVYSVDISKVWTAKHHRVTYLQGNGRDLGALFSDEFLAGLPRPLLVVEDADHSYLTTKAVLDFFHTRLIPGEYIIVEDVLTMPEEAGRALREFLALHSRQYLVDGHYCDFFGVNLTWCVNGFLRRLGS